MSDLYKRIAELCELGKITITTMCKESGANRASLSDLKMGRKQNLSAGTLSKIANYFGVTVDYLIGEEKETAPTPKDEREINDEDLKAAFWGGEKDLSSEELDALWEDVREYARYKAEQRRKKKHE